MRELFVILATIVFNILLCFGLIIAPAHPIYTVGFIILFVSSILLAKYFLDFVEPYDEISKIKWKIKRDEKRHQLEKQQIADELRRKQEIKELKKLYEQSYS